MPYTTDNRKWASGQCDFRIDPDWNAAWMQSADDAMQMWNGAGAKFAFGVNQSSSNELTSFDNGFWNGWIAMTYPDPTPSGSNLRRARILINCYFEFDPPHPVIPHRDKSGAFDLKTVLTHELGHTLYLGDDRSAGSSTIMRPLFKPGDVRSLDSDDENGIRYLYP
jgi:hypothetical protein